MPSDTPTGSPFALKRLLWLVPLLVVWALLLAEVYVRVVFPVQIQPRYVVDAPYGVRQNKPSMTYYHSSEFYRVRYDINSKGVRADREIPYERAAGTFRIVVFGDSFGMSYEADLADAWTTRLEEALRAEHGCNAEVVNLSVSGHGTAEQLLAWQNEGYKYSPDLVLLEWHLTDLDDNIRSRLFRIEKGALVRDQETYLPVMAEQRLFEHAAYRLLAENSMFYAWLRQAISTRVNRWMAADAVESASSAPGSEGQGDPRAALSIRLLQAFREDVEGRGASFAVLEVPWKVDANTFTAVFPEGSGMEALKYSPLPDFARYRGQHVYWELPGGHFTPLGNRIVGAGLARHLAAACAAVAGGKSESGPLPATVIDRTTGSGAVDDL